MSPLTFWKEWEPQAQLLFKSLSFLLICLLLAFLTIEWGGLTPFYYWKLTGYLENVPFPVFSQHSSFIESTVTTDMPLIFQKLLGGARALSAGYSYIYLIILYIGFIGLLTISTFLEKFWYFLSMGLWILLIVMAGVGKLGLFGFYGEAPVVLMVILFLPVSYYFNVINESVSLLIRFLTFLGLLMVMLVLIQLGSSFDAPLLFLTQFSYLPAFAVCLVFILITGHEVIYAILSLTTPYSSSSSNNAKHFTILSAVYLINLVVLYLHRIGYLQWNIYYLNEFFLMALSTVIGIWGIKSRENRYRGILPFYPYTMFLYLSLALISVATFVYQSWHANDPFIESVRNLILYSHLGFGSMFFFYIISNFITQLRQNLPVHRFAFEEQNFPYITSKLAGMIVVAALFFKANYASMHLAISGYYIGLADINHSLGKPEVASHYYKESISQSRHNHHANFQLAQFEERPAYRLTYLKNSLKKKPSAFAYASLGREYENNNQFFEALFNYQEGLKIFPNNWALQNNLALLYNKTDVLDSALYYLDNHSVSSWQKAVVGANREAVSARHRLGLTGRELDQPERFDLQANVLANKLMSDDTSALNFITEPQSRALNLFTYGYLKNLGLYCYKTKSRAFVKIIDPYLETPENISFKGDLLLVKSLNLYQLGRVAEAIEIIYQLKESTEDTSGKWDALLGKWSLEQGAAMQAAELFETARESGFAEVSADLAQAYYQVGDKSIAMFLLSKAGQTADSAKAWAWSALFDAAQKDQVRWKSYDFEREKALLAQADKSSNSVLYESLGMNNPFFEEGVIAAVKYFKEVEKNEQTAYHILHRAITFNLYSEQLIKTYIDHCLETGLIDFAEDILPRLKDTLSPEAFEEYLAIFDAAKAHAQSDLDHNW